MPIWKSYTGGPGTNEFPKQPLLIDDDDLTDEEVYTFAPGETESIGPVTLPNGIVVGPNEMVDSDGTRRPNPYLPPPEA